MAIENKQFALKVFDGNGVFKKTFGDSYFSTKPTFTQNISGGLTEMTLSVNKETSEYFQSTGEFFDVPRAGDLCKIYVYDKETPNGTVIYSGIYRGTNILMDGKNHTFDLKFLPNTLQLARRILRDASLNTTVSFSSEDPADMFRNIIDTANSFVSYNETSIRDLGLQRSYTFKTEYCLDALKKTSGLLPKGWFFYVGADDLVYLRNHDQGQPELYKWDETTWGGGFWGFDPNTDATEVHRLYMGTHISNVQASNDLGEMTNRVVFLGGDTGGGTYLFKEFNNTASQNLFGVYEKIIVDQRVTLESTAEFKANKLLNDQSIFQSDLQVTVIDSNIKDGTGYDIESLKIGDKIIIYGSDQDGEYIKWGAVNWGESWWLTAPYTLFGIEYIIKKINYRWDNCVLQLDVEPEQNTERIEDVNRDLVQSEMTNAPDAPT